MVVDVRGILACGLAGTLASCMTGCSEDALVRPQVLLFVDTDAPLVGQLADGSPDLREYSNDATIDTLRIDVYPPDSHGCPRESHVVVKPDRLDWPVSFGILPVDDKVEVSLRIRAFRGLRATKDVCGAPSPPAEVAIDRLVTVVVPAVGVDYRRVVLASDCRGVRNTGDVTCVDKDHMDADRKEGIEALGGPPDPSKSLVGTWEGAKEQPCPETLVATPERICVPGGFSILGDERIDFDRVELIRSTESLPLRPVIVSPFLMDRTEFTVRRFNALLAVPGNLEKIEEVGMPTMAAPVGDAHCSCTWLGASNHENDDYPLNCVSWKTARRICELDGGGDLPTQAQWEHAARGRGRGWLFPWGDEVPTCCRTGWGRGFLKKGCGAVASVVCEGFGVEPVGSYQSGKVDCAEGGNESLDRILDLGGNVAEATLDVLKRYDDECWAKEQQGVWVDPVCAAESGGFHVAHGGEGTQGITLVTGSTRKPWIDNDASGGFRCVHTGAP